jgi:protoporphyrinogen oxidase
MSNSTQRAVIIGAGPAGLTAAFELTKRSGIIPVVLEKSSDMGGISRTINYKGNRMDIGGHRFFSKSDRVMDWWMNIMPAEEGVSGQQQISYHNQHRFLQTRNGSGTNDPDRVMLIRPRKSRIYFLRRFFDYPIRLTPDTIKKLGLFRTIMIGLSYMKSMARQIRPERNLEQFLINRFGRELYLTFFKSYTEKVWGVACHQISAEWGAQRIKGLSITTALLHFAKRAISSKPDIGQKSTETSLIENFLYPKFGPGQLWDYVARTVKSEGGEILTGWTVDKIKVDGDRVTGVEAVHDETGRRQVIAADYVFSTMPIKELFQALDTNIPANAWEVSQGLIYRDFITVGLLLERLVISEETADGKKLLKDNWIYIQEPDVLVGRMQIFNNWSPYMVADPSKVWIGLEYFCYDIDELWGKSDEDMIALAVAEMQKIGIVSKTDVLDATVIRVPKTYPAYFGIYDRFAEVREYVDRFQNLFLVGRNGMHKYNNQDHSMLTAMTAVDNILEGRIDKSNIWDVNTEVEYHEEKHKPSEGTTAAGVVHGAVQGKRL